MDALVEMIQAQSRMEIRIHVRFAHHGRDNELKKAPVKTALRTVLGPHACPLLIRPHVKFYQYRHLHGLFAKEAQCGCKSQSCETLAQSGLERDQSSVSRRKKNKYVCEKTFSAMNGTRKMLGMRCSAVKKVRVICRYFVFLPTRVCTMHSSYLGPWDIYKYRMLLQNSPTYTCLLHFVCIAALISFFLSLFAKMRH
jgi:hypothetical protein